MSLVSSSTLYEAIRADVVAAWGADSVTFGLPQIEPTALPYAIVSLGSVSMAPSSITTIEQTYEFACMCVDAWGTDPDWNIELAKESRANALITRLMANPIYAGVGILPQILSVMFDESDDATQPFYYVTVTFSVVQVVRALVS